MIFTIFTYYVCMYISYNRTKMFMKLQQNLNYAEHVFKIQEGKLKSLSEYQCCKLVSQ